MISSGPLSVNGTSLRTFLCFMAAAVAAIFLLAAALTVLEHNNRFASSNVEALTSNVSSETLLHFIGFENPYFTQVLPENSEFPPLASLGFEFVTSIKPGDIRSLLGSELPGFEIYDSDIIVAGTGTDYTNLVVESAPPVKVMMEAREEAEQSLKQNDDQKDVVKPPVKTTNGKDVVLLYATHTTESYLPALKGDASPDEAYSWELNVSDVAKQLKEELEKRGIGAEVPDVNIQKIRASEGLSYSQSYKASRQVVASILHEDPSIQMIFDIHRDSRRKKDTTVTINGKKYARTSFVIGEGNPHYKKNRLMAVNLHHLLEKEYPGLSRAVIGKSLDEGNGIYNQDLSDHAVLIEIGGVDNTMDEVNRTVEALADVISEYYWKLHKAQKVNG
ncbi:MAG TPA: stage II sporulation protein P [Bacillales bacterium]|nr:stage II sporulation protein P [Bacillales bacterium]